MLTIIHIVIDIDNTILDGTSTHLKYCNLVSGRKIKKEDVTQFYLYHYYDWNMEDFLKVYEQYGVEMHDESLPLEGAIQTIQALKETHQITFMTARPEKYRGVTEGWLQRYNIPYDQLIMTEGKLEAFNTIKGDVLIDDSPIYAEQFMQNQQSMILIDYPYNKGFESEWIKRASSWSMVYELLLNKTKV